MLSPVFKLTMAAAAEKRPRRTARRGMDNLSLSDT
jgi:hypothetical protein